MRNLRTRTNKHATANPLASFLVPIIIITLTMRFHFFRHIQLQLTATIMNKKMVQIDCETNSYLFNMFRVNVIEGGVHLCL